MKKILLSGVLAAAVLAGPGCKKEYLQTNPTDRVDNVAIFATADNANVALNGIYRYMFERTTATTSNVQGKPGVAGILLGIDFMGEDLHQANATWFTSTGEGNYVASRNDNAGSNLYYYRTFFRMIGNANAIIDNIDAAEGTADAKARIKAEALTIRAYSYSYLVQFYGNRYDPNNKPNNQLAVPMPLTATDSKMPRVSVETIYTQIIKDLDAAIALNAVPANKTHASVWVARGLRARVALTMGDYATAITFAKQVVDGNQFPLMSIADYQTGFNNLNLSEYMWGCNPTTEQGDTFGSVFAQIAYNANTTYQRGTPKMINSALYDRISSTDVRKKMWEPTPTATNFPLPTTAFTRRPYMSRKFSVKTVGDPSLGDYPWMRSAEMHLILAEAYARSGQTALAQAALFALVSKRDLSATISTKIGTALIDEIMDNRRVELWGEGFRYLDLKRLNLPLNRTAVPNYVSASVNDVMQIPAGDPRFLFLIPRDEINANPNLGPQNP
ncbi:RagB/SusD family nutrient uptake outer membrane protein [Mucilaginibacter daejeonensis]|uniref:RagB/SusD family nutrient uptake outer membrane protein n=1 Tax=Mucilaginibacter daejeonensis TaxID=398049 RepID=UPI001D177B0E|nr:RagB/SusD family nutrient uptake outer membrane protein [Mucilaginibacter daejeonensis]UEG53549.1 RagB/SusD family nutrient uptake outer membrane protein [Mucilaginibacter daejeonensis]